jgi:hypothetical protein
MSNSSIRASLSNRYFWAAIILAAVAIVALTALLVNIIERKQEARNPFYRVVALDDQTQDPAVWGKNFPLQYDDYRRTVIKNVLGTVAVKRFLVLPRKLTRVRSPPSPAWRKILG